MNKTKKKKCWIDSNNSIENQNSNNIEGPPFFSDPLTDLKLPLDKLNHPSTHSHLGIVPSRLSKLFGEKHQNHLMCKKHKKIFSQSSVVWKHELLLCIVILVPSTICTKKN